MYSVKRFLTEINQYSAIYTIKNRIAKFLISKSRINMVDIHSIPRKELAGAVLEVEMAKSLSKYVPRKKTLFLQIQQLF